MTTPDDDIRAFIERNGFGPASVDMSGCCDLFLDEMSRGLRGERSSLAMIPTYIQGTGTIPVNEPVVVLDAGGTNFRTCVVRFVEESSSTGATILRPVIESFKKSPMPGSSQAATAEEFFGQMADQVAGIIPQSRQIGFCFSYAAEITPDRDGRLLYFSKEIQAPEVAGRLVGASLLEALSRRGVDTSNHRVTVLNDTVATLLAGRVSKNDIDYSGYLGFILGTGTNTCYMERESEIHTLKRELGGSGTQLINTESGNFAYPGSAMDRSFYATTAQPAMYHFEKLVSGAYLGPYALHVLRQAAKEGLLSEPCAERIRAISSMNTIVMDRFLHDPMAASVNAAESGNLLATTTSLDSDRSVIYHILDAIIRRAACLTAVNLTAMVKKSGAGRDPEHPVCVNADGTTFFKTHKLMSYTLEYIDSFLKRGSGLHVDIISVNDSPIIGAAVAGLIR